MAFQSAYCNCVPVIFPFVLLTSHISAWESKLLYSVLLYYWSTDSIECIWNVKMQHNTYFWARAFLVTFCFKNLTCGIGIDMFPCRQPPWCVGAFCKALMLGIIWMCSASVAINGSHVRTEWCHLCCEWMHDPNKVCSLSNVYIHHTVQEK